MRRCRKKKIEVLKELDAKRQNNALNQMVFYDKYNDFLVFDVPQNQLKIVIAILFAILDYNRNLNKLEDQQFLCFFEPLLNRCAANSFCQSLVKAWHFRKSLEKLPVESIIERRAAYCI